MVEKILKENGIEYMPQYKNNRLIGRKSVDLYLPKYKIAIECKGIQHFKEVERFGWEKFKRNNQKRLC